MPQECLVDLRHDEDRKAAAQSGRGASIVVGDGSTLRFAAVSTTSRRHSLHRRASRHIPRQISGRHGHCSRVSQWSPS
jgi:hypothetical protein